METTNENTTYQKLSDTAEAMLRRNLIALNAYIRKEEESQINYLNSHLKNLEKEERGKKQRKKILKMRTQISENENRKTIEKIYETKSCSVKISIKLTNL